MRPQPRYGPRAPEQYCIIYIYIYIYPCIFARHCEHVSTQTAPPPPSSDQLPPIARRAARRGGAAPRRTRGLAEARGWLRGGESRGEGGSDRAAAAAAERVPAGPLPEVRGPCRQGWAPPSRTPPPPYLSPSPLPPFSPGLSRRARSRLVPPAGGGRLCIRNEHDIVGRASAHMHTHTHARTHTYTHAHTPAGIGRPADVCVRALARARK